MTDMTVRIGAGYAAPVLVAIRPFMRHMTVLSRVLMGLAALVLVAMFVAPLWRIDLVAPQYPEGLGMLIRINTIEGQTPQDLNSINMLNHYIGMKEIAPEAFPVLRVMPWVLGALAAFAAIVAIAGRRRLIAAWLVTFAVAGAAGLFEFWRWSYDYGHNLAPDAIIKVPGMTYQPPLIGTKQLLNFTAASWPALGGWLAAVAFALGIAAMLIPWWAERRARSVHPITLATAGSLA